MALAPGERAKWGFLILAANRGRKPAGGRAAAGRVVSVGGQAEGPVCAGVGTANGADVAGMAPGLRDAQGETARKPRTKLQKPGDAGVVTTEQLRDAALAAVQRVRRSNAAAADAATGGLVCPDWLSDSAREVWNRVVPWLVANGVALAVDLEVVALYCHSQAMLVSCVDAIRRDGLVIEGSHGGLVRHPLAGTMVQMQDQVRRLSAELGLSPLARLRVTPVGQQDDDPFAEFGLK